ncbi:hypothetical protein SANA_29180 [Gottschalkiaceae bacterium SANA]|nr:hypothetical protein SANA_29180 [Gottschalkiaceae bacterium SANA]
MEVKISVIMPAYNASRFINEAIASVVEQSEKNWELIIVNDASTDATSEMVEEWMKREPRIHHIDMEENQGSAAARNRGLEQAKGRYLAFLDADDLWHPEKLRRQIAFMEETGSVVSFTEYDRVDEYGEVLQKAESLPDAVTHEMMLKRNWMGCLTVVVDKTAFERVWFPSLRKRQDYALWLQLMREVKQPALCLHQTLASHRFHKNSISKKKVGLVKYNYRVFRKHEKMGPLSSAWSVVQNIFHRLRGHGSSEMGNASFLKKTALLIAMLTVVSRATGFLREIFIAKTFGTGIEADSFFLMNAIVSFIWLFSGVFSNGMIPLLIEIRNRKGDEENLIRRLTQGLVFLYGVIVAILLFFAPTVVGFIGYGFSSSSQELTVTLFRIGVFSIFFGAMNDLHVNYLKSHQSFLVSNFAGIYSNLVYIAFFMVLPVRFQSIEGLAVAMVLSSITKYLTTVPYMRRLGYRYHWVPKFWDSDDVKKLARLSIPLLMGSVVYHINGIVDKILATPLETGSVAALNYSNRIIGTYEALILAVIVTLLFPTLSHFAQTDKERFRRVLDRSLRVMVDLLIPSTIGLMVLAEAVVTVIYRRGAFDLLALAQTTSLLRIYAAAILAAGVNSLYVKGFYANQDTETPMKIGMISVAANIALDLLLVGPYGVQGLAAATAIAGYLGMFLRKWKFQQYFGKADVDSRLPAMLPPLIASVAMVLVIWPLQQYLGPHYLTHMNLLVKMGGLAVVILSGALTYLLVLRLFNPPEWKWLMKR